MDLKHTPQLERILRMAAIEAERDQSGHVGVEHLLVAMAQENSNTGAEMIRKFGLTLDDLRNLDFTTKST